MTFIIRRMPKALNIALVLVTILSSCSNHKAEHEAGEFSITKPWRQNLIIEKKYVAQIHAIQHIELRAFEKGYLKNIFVDEGQLIEKGTEMFEITPLIIQAEYQKSKAEYDLVKLEYKNTKRLQNKNVVSKNELALVKAKLNKARAELSISQAHLDFTHIKAPFKGMMDKFHVRPGSLVDEGDLLTTLSDISKVWVYFNVSEVDYLNYIKFKKSEGDNRVWLELANGELFDQIGTLDTIEADFNNETGNVAFRATFANPQKLLRHGQTGNIIIKEKISNALVIPQKSTFEILDKRFVYVVGKDNIVESRAIEVQQEVPHLFAIRSGLKESDQIILDGIGKIRAGQRVETKIQETRKVLASLNLPLN